MSNSPERDRIAYFALDVPHAGQASYVHINEIVNNLRRLGWQVDLFAPSPAQGAQRHRLWRRIQLQLVTIRAALRRLHDYEIFYIRAHPAAWPITFAARRRGLAVVQEINGTERDVIINHPWLRFIRPIVHWLYWSQYRVSDRLFPVTHELAQWLRAEVKDERITTIPNAANTDLFRPREIKDDPFVVFFGGLTAWHGVDMMIAATRHELWPRGVTLLVIGTGANETKIAEAVRDGLPIRWVGHKSYETIPDLIAGARAGLIPIANPQGRSSTGVLPLKLYETLACGIPAIVTDLPGQADLVRGARCGLVVPCDDEAALAAAVAQLTANPAAAREMGKRGASLVRAEHSWAVRAATIDGVLRELLRQRAA